MFQWTLVSFMVCEFAVAVSTFESKLMSLDSSTRDVILELTHRVDALESRDLQTQMTLKATQNKLRLFEEENKHQSIEIARLRNELETKYNKETKPSIRKKSSSELKSTESHANRTIQTIRTIRAPFPRQTIRSPENGMEVAFFATLLYNYQHLGEHQIVVFDNVVTNIGDGYKLLIGIFIAPVSGTYLFSSSLNAYGYDTTHFGFALNGNVFTVMFLNGEENRGDRVSQTVVLHLKGGDEVGIEHLGIDKGLFGENHSLFSGVLLRASVPPQFASVH